MTDHAVAADVRTGLEALLTSYLEENRALRAERDALAAQVAQLETATARRSILNPDALRSRAELADVLAGAVLVLTDSRGGDGVAVTADAIHRRGGADALEVTFGPDFERYTIRPKAPR